MIKKIGVLYISQIYKAALPLIFVPLIMKELGVEEYGMVSFFSMLLGWLGLFDAGISGTFIKLVATNKNEKDRFNKVCALFNKVSILFILIAMLMVVFTVINASNIATKWLNTSININVVEYCISIIGVILSVSYLRGYVASFLNGMEKQMLIAGWSTLSTSVLYFLPYWAIKNMDDKLSLYFIMIAIVSVVDLIVNVLMVAFTIKSTRLRLEAFPPVIVHSDTNITFTSVLKFSLQLSGLSLIWVVATQIDKLVLSTYSELSAYAHYQIAAQVGASLAIFSSPLSQILLPRLSALYTEKKETEFVTTLVKYFVFFLIILGPIIPYFFFFGDKLISFWMQNELIGAEISVYAKWLVSASYISASMNFLFMFLYAQNKLKYHFYAYSLYSLLTIPLSIFVAKYYGAYMSSKFVFVHNLVFMMLWGGWCVRKNLNNFSGVFFVSMLVVFLISSISFFLFSKLDLSSFYYNFIVFSVLFPVVNLIILLLVFYCLRKPLKRRLDFVSLKVS